MMNLSRLESSGLFDLNVPRYTSYPTATHFSNAMQADVMSDWLSALDPATSISLYFHIPFCRRLCWFCACRTQGLGDDSRLQRYLSALQQEMRLVAQYLPEGVQVGRIHLGGGTPTLLVPQQLDSLLSAVGENFELQKEREFSVEIDPNEIDCERLDVLVNHGMNRVSIGVQDFDPKIQQAIGREQSFEVTEACIAKCRIRGVTSLNADILYGLPYQTEESLERSIEQLMGLNPDRVALYGYAHVPWMAKRQTMIPQEALPPTRARFLMSERAKVIFHGGGYEAIGIDHFAKPTDGLAIAANTGRLRRNFQGYTDDCAPTLIGLGASSISKFSGGYAQNDPKIGGYYERIDNGVFATTRGHVFSGDDALRARAIEMLLCDFSLDLTSLALEFPDQCLATIHELIDDVRERFHEWVELSADRLEIRRDGRPLTRMIAQCFDAYDVANNAHSSAI